MVLLTMNTVKGIWEGAIYILIFGTGTVVGMLIMTTIIGVPFVFSANRIRINKSLVQITGVISMVFGFYYMYTLGVTAGLFRLRTQ